MNESQRDWPDPSDQTEHAKALFMVVLGAVGGSLGALALNHTVLGQYLLSDQLNRYLTWTSAHPYQSLSDTMAFITVVVIGACLLVGLGTILVYHPEDF